MTAEREALIDHLIQSVPGAQRSDGGDWHVEKGDRAVAIDDDPDDSGQYFSLHLMQCTERTADSETWGFADDTYVEPADTAIEVVRKWLQ